MKKKIMLLLYILIFQIFSINQEQIAFAEIANVQTEEKINNNSFNETEISPSISGFGYGIEAINPYEINIGDGFDISYPYIGGKTPNGDQIHLRDIKVYWHGGTPIFPNKLGDTGILVYEYKSPSFDQLLSIPVKVVARDGRRAELKDTELYVGQKWDLGSVFKNVRDRDGNPMKPEQVNDVWINDSRTKKVDTSKPGIYDVAIAVSSPRTKPKLYSEKAFVRVKEDKTKAELKDTELYVGQKWDLGSVFENVVDKDGNPIKPEEVEWVWVDGKEKVREIDTSKPSKHTVSIAVRNAADNNYWVTSNTATVTVKEDKTKAELKDTELYVGQKWDLGSVFENVVDKDGNPIKPEEVEWVWVDGKEKVREIDTSKPGKHTVSIAVRNAADNNYWVTSNTATVTVKEDKTSLEVNGGTHYIYQGEKWDPKRGFKKATDADGNTLSIDEVEQWWGSDNPIDSNKVGDKRPYFYAIYKKDKSRIYYNIYVEVKENKASIKTKGSTLYVGEKWDPKDNFVNATDEDGKSIPWEDSRITKNGASIDTSKPGEHKIKYTFQGKFKKVDSEFTVIVKEEPFMLKHVSDFNFGEKELSLINKLVVNKKENPTIEVETPSIVGKDWQLQVELSPFLDKENSKSILKGVSLFIPKGKLESDLETEEPTQYDCQLEANGKASILMHGTKTKGKGRWKNKLATKGITLSIPPENKTGNYESTLHWTLLDVPG
ncbi:bacterial Ig-like domain-containing protein [Enterococcus faecalis]|uniref:bacterial Ig-like domain-containing protein n=1 Tax=Enterococcus faecalis TaxID=1351 RepID=UPI000DE93105|nr:bacterial Ig-like domain-containing protein [Enterococcus faecalis]RBR47130.1 hypothetical protein EB28_01346 [Enterococcus faecalis]